MRFIYLFLVVVSLGGCQSYKPVSFFFEKPIGGGTDELEPGACFYSALDFYRKARLIEVRAAVYKMVFRRLPDSLVEQYRPLDDDELIHIDVKKGEIKYRLRRLPAECVYQEPWSYFTVCTYESPSQSSIFNKSALDSLDYFVTFKELVTPTVVLEKYYEGVEQGVMENQIYVPAGYYSPFKQVVCGSCGYYGGGLYLNRFMKQRGYKPTINREKIKRARFEFGVEKLPAIFDIYFGL